jgi:hypothetical protein
MAEARPPLTRQAKIVGVVILGAVALSVLGIVLLVMLAPSRPMPDKPRGDDTTTDPPSPRATPAELHAAEEPALRTIGAEQLVRAYEENPIRADQQWKGERVEITGQIDDIGKDILVSRI